MLAKRLPGAVVPSDEAAAEAEEHAQHDPALVWPSPKVLESLPADWLATVRGAKKKESQPYFLNHVRGSTRLRQATVRVAGALGTLAMVATLALTVDQQPPQQIGLHLDLRDLACGVAVGAGIVLLLFGAEVALGWLRIVGYCEVVVPTESLPLNLLWDVVFHMGVSVQEEVSLRGWLLVNAAQAIAAHTAPSSSIAVSMGLSVVLQSSIFALLHLGSPGASKVGLANLVVGGTCGALNVVLSGGLSFGLGWHFGWNLLMGHLLGMSTSGIPMSAKLVSVVPHPAKAHLHGGKFGPEQSPLAPLAYLLGCAALLALYGTSGVEAWRMRLATPEAGSGAASALAEQLLSGN